MKTMKIGAIFLVSALALAGIGASYALWSETLTINGTINTGNVDVEWSIKDVWDDETKDVSDITATIEDDGTMTVTITNAYPCVNYYVRFDIHCLGTVPVHFQDFVITGPDCAEITITPETGYDPITDTQLHQSQEWLGILKIHLDNTAEENATYTFTITILAHQYNETPE